jgi:hypothetical protein
MSKLVELYVLELTKEDATMDINDVPARLRSDVQAAIEALQKAAQQGAGE